MTRTIVVGVHQLEEPQTGGWCGPCALPSLITQRFVLTINGRPHEVVAATACDECGRRSR